jgi:glycerol uptake facilitator-like aquaporin
MFVIKGKKAICEFIGTFFFTLSISLCSVYAGTLAPIPIGFTLMAQVPCQAASLSGAAHSLFVASVSAIPTAQIPTDAPQQISQHATAPANAAACRSNLSVLPGLQVFAFGYISGAHFNPAVTLGVVLIRQLKVRRATFYVFAQMLASVCAGVVGMFLIAPADKSKVAPPMPVFNTTDFSSTPQDICRAFFSELVFTVCLVTVVLHVACSRQRDNNHYGLAIGMTVMGSAFSVSSISGGGFNPAVATGLVVQECLAGQCRAARYLWLYWLAPLVGAAIAALLFEIVHALEVEEHYIYNVDKVRKQDSEQQDAADKPLVTLLSASQGEAVPH